MKKTASMYKNENRIYSFTIVHWNIQLQNAIYKYLLKEQTFNNLLERQVSQEVIGVQTSLRHMTTKMLCTYVRLGFKNT